MITDWRDHFLKSRTKAGPKWATPLTMAQALDPKVKITPALHVVDQALVRAYNTPDSRLIVQLPPQSGKSQTTSRRFPLWVLTQNPDTRITLASYETAVARRWGRAVRDDILMHSDTLGFTVRSDLSAQHEWQLAGYEGGMFTAGIGSALTGRPSQLMLIDDPVKNHEDAMSKVKQETAWNWWTETAQTRLHPGTPVILILTRWSTGDLAGRILDEPGGDRWEVLNIPAQADHDPSKGETDPIGRVPGEYLETVHGMTTEQWEERKRSTGPKAFAALYQGNPSPDEGGVFPQEWARYNSPVWIVRDDGTHLVPGIQRDDQELAISADLAFRDADTSDYVVIQVWLRIGVDVYLVDMIRERMNFNATLDALRRVSAKWPQAVQKFIEARANGDAAINALSRELFGLIPIEPLGSKHARASAVSPLAFSGNIKLPTSNLLPNVEELIEEARGFPGGKNDDTIDALSMGVNQLLLNPLSEGGLTQPEDYDLMDERGWTISPW